MTQYEGMTQDETPARLNRDWSIPSMHHCVGAGTGQSICMPFWVVKLRRICEMLKKYCLYPTYILAFIVCFSRVSVIALELVVSYKVKNPFW